MLAAEARGPSMAVYTEVSDEDLAGFFAGHGLGQLRSFKGIAEGVENTNYMVETAHPSGTSRRFILTIYEKRVRREDLPFFLGLIEHLSKKGIACPLPVRARDGAAWRELNSRPAAVMNFLPGLSPRKPLANGVAFFEAARELHFVRELRHRMRPFAYQSLYCHGGSPGFQPNHISCSPHS